MSGMRGLLGLGLLLALAACDSERPEAERQPAPAPSVQQEQPAPPPASEPAAPPLPVASPAKVAPEPSAVTPVPPQRPPSPAAQAPQPAVVPKPSAPSQRAAVIAPPVGMAPKEPARPLDLSLPGDDAERFPLPTDPASVLSEGEEGADALLPPLFQAQEQARPPFELGGRLITNEGAEDGYLDTIQGAELQLRFRR